MWPHGDLNHMLRVLHLDVDGCDDLVTLNPGNYPLGPPKVLLSCVEPRLGTTEIKGMNSHWKAASAVPQSSPQE